MKRKTYEEANIAFIHGRPGPHPTHRAFAESINSDFVFVDRILRYHDVENAGKLRTYISWFANSLFFQDIKKYDLLLAEGMHIPPVIMKKLKILSPNQRIAAMLGDEVLFFLATKWYPRKSQKFLSYILSQYDALICLSDFQTELAHQILNNKKEKPLIVSGHEIISSDRPKPDLNRKPKLNGHNLLFIAHGPSGWRGFYKGIETLLKTFKIIKEKYNDAELTVIGNWDENYVNGLLEKTGNTRTNINFVGTQKDLLSFFEKADLYIHITNGDAFPIATLEAIRAGVPVLLSEHTGTKEVVCKIDERLVVPMDAVSAAKGIEWYFDLPLEAKKNLSEIGCSVMESYYTAERGIAEFKDAVNKILQ